MKSTANIKFDSTPMKVVRIGMDQVLFATVVLLVGIGTVLIYSSSSIYAEVRFRDDFYFLKLRGIHIIIGFICMFIAFKIPFHFYQRVVHLILLLGILGLYLCLVPGIGVTEGGASRWIRLGPLSFQPSDAAKLGLVIYLAYSLAKKAERKKIKSFSIGFLPHLCIVGIMVFLLLKQPDFGTSVLFLLLMFSMLFVAGTKMSYLLIAFGSAIPFAYHLIINSEYRMKRIMAFLDPWRYRKDVGYQISESLISIGSGGIFGLGLGEGRQKLFFLPAAHTDFIFSAIGEELGFIGVVMILILLGVVIWRGIRIGLNAIDLFSMFLAFGISILLSLQIIINVGVTLGIFPAKGLPLPFLSYGGSSLVITLFGIGILLNISSFRLIPLSDKQEERKEEKECG
jgi:cell division protein FtsW